MKRDEKIFDIIELCFLFAMVFLAILNTVSWICKWNISTLTIEMIYMCPMLTIGAIGFIRWARGIEHEEKDKEKDGDKSK